MDQAGIKAIHGPRIQGMVDAMVCQAFEAGVAQGAEEVVLAARELLAELDSYPELIPHNDHRFLCPRCQIESRIERLRKALGR